MGKQKGDGKGIEREWHLKKIKKQEHQFECECNFRRVGFIALLIKARILGPD